MPKFETWPLTNTPMLDPVEVFLAGHPIVAAAADSSRTLLTEAFGKATPVVMTLFEDPDEPGQPPILVLTVYSPLPIVEAMDIMERLEDKLLALAGPVQGMLLVRYEPE